MCALRADLGPSSKSARPDRDAIRGLDFLLASPGLPAQPESQTKNCPGDMMTNQSKSADDMVAEADTGARNPAAAWQANLIVGTCIVWSLFQLYIAAFKVL